MDELTLIKNAVLAAVPSVEKMYLYGSRACGDEREDSDYDLFLVVRDDSPRQLDVMEAAYRSVRELKISKPVDIFAMKKNDFAKRRELPTMERTVSREGVLLYGHNV